MPSIFSTDLIVNRGQGKVPSKYTTFTERWYLLLAALLLNIFYGMLCTALLPLPKTAFETICGNKTTFNCGHMQFLLISSYPVGFLLGVIPSTILIIRIGILPSLVTAFLAGLLSISIRFVGLTVNGVAHYLYLFVLVSHAIHALTHPIGLLLSVAISHYWFPSGQRTVATSLVITGYFLGFLSSFVLTPNIVDENSTLKDLTNLTYINFAFGVLTFVPLLAVRRSRPLIPPSASADDALVVRRCKQKSLLNSTTLVHCLVFASFAGALLFTMQLHNQILCVHGYLLGFSGLHALILMISVLVSVVLSSITDTLYAHKKLYKICFASLTVASCALSWANSSDSKQVFVFLSLIVFGLLGAALYSIAIELSVESAFSTNPVKVSALFFASGYFGEFIYIVAAVLVRRNTRKQQPYPDENCQVHGNMEDYSAVQIVISLVLLIFFLLSLVCLRFEPNRRNHESTAENMRINNVITTNPLGTGELRTRC